MRFEHWQVELISATRGLESVSHAYWFVQNNQAMNREAFMQVAEKISELCGSQGVKWATMLMSHGTWVFTDAPIQVDPLMVKLSTGLNFEGEVLDAQDAIDQVNTFLSGKKI